MSKSNWTLRHPRTLDEAFGDGTPRKIVDPHERKLSADTIITIVSGTIIIGLIVLPLLGLMR